MTEIIYKEESYKIIGACMKVHAALGAGFLESVYQEALEKQFIKDQIPYAREKILKVHFDGHELRKTFKADFVCYDQIIVELKSSSFIHIDNIAQTKTYLKATQCRLGLLVNFGEKSLTYKRVLHSFN
jgi:GxxExxY protein